MLLFFWEKVLVYLGITQLGITGMLWYNKDCDIKDNFYFIKKNMRILFIIESKIIKNVSRAILRYSFCRGRDILNIHLFITLSISMVETSYGTYLEAVTYVFQCMVKFFL